MTKKDKKMEDVVTDTIGTPYSVNITKDGYILITLPAETLLELYEKAREHGKAIIAIRAPELICN
jgi:hypothetical protein